MLPGIVGLIQATEALKLILEKGKNLVGRLILFDAMKMNFKNVKLERDPNCDLCGIQPTITELIDYKAFCEIPMPSAEKEDDDFDEESYSIEPEELANILNAGKEIALVDVREQSEWDICYIENAQLMPLSEFDEHISSLNRDEEIYLYCYKGTRSMKALKQLHEEGFTKLKSLTGGIDRWAEEIDSDMPRY